MIIYLGEDIARGYPVPVRGQQFERQPRVQVWQPLPGDQHRDVLLERMLAGVGLAADPLGERPVAADELLVFGGQAVEIPPLPDLDGQIRIAEMVGPEDVHVTGQVPAGENLRHLTRQVPGRHPYPGRHSAEAEPGQPGTQLMALVTLTLRYREDDQD